MSDFYLGVIVGSVVTAIILVVIALMINAWLSDTPEQLAHIYRAHFNRFDRELERTSPAPSGYTSSVPDPTPIERDDKGWPMYMLVAFGIIIAIGFFSVFG